MLLARGWDKRGSGSRFLVLGFFDGLHRGHREVLGRAYHVGQREGGVIEIVTFYPHPQNFLARKRNYPLQYLTSYGEKYCLLQQFFPGIFLRFIRFDKKMRCTAPQKFLDSIHSRLTPKKIFVGENFRFGYQATGDVSVLRQYFETRDIEVVSVPSLEDRGLCISSSSIRSLLAEGNLERVNSLLGYHFTIMGKVHRGRRLGSQLGFPTANLYPPSTKILPPHGVYISYITWETPENWIPALTHVGYRPTLQDYHRRVIETFVPSVSSLDLYGQRVTVRLVSFVRAERAFPSVQELKKQIALDLEAFYRYLQGGNSVINYPLNAILEV
ncbi:MAG: riboflavin biosynthesis protein RibF [Candidatus Caldatribacteriaceae bacterium]